MLFNSYIFILLFLPLCIVGYFTLNHYKQYKWGQAFLLAMSLWFYGYNSVKYLGVLVASVLINYGVYLFLEKNDSTSESIGKENNNKCNRRKIIMIFGVMINVGILLYFKYMDFFIDNINGIFKTDIAFLRIALPLGISFFTFQQISFIVDAYRGEIPGYRFLDYACFVTYFPQLIAGPIVTHDELVPQFMDEEKKKFNADNMLRGIYIFTLGLAKKVLLADTFGKVVNYGYMVPDTLNTATAMITILAYTIQIYFDFSGYCDMAIGIGKMMNIDLPLNFNSPYKACTIIEFWDRWHMTLTRFFTRYVYIPLGGSRKGNARTYINVFLVFLISGFWHGASWNFVLWGVMHGVLNILTRLCKTIVDKVPKAINWLFTFVFVNVAWVFFRAESIPQAFTILRKALSGPFVVTDGAFYELISSAEIKEVMSFLPIEERFPGFVLVVYFAVALLLLLGSKNAYEKSLRFKPTIFNMGMTLFLLVWSVFSFSGISTFLYFNF